MPFDLTSGLVIVGLIVRRWKSLFKSKLGLLVSVVISIVASSVLTPIYAIILRSLGINIDTSSKIVSFIITFIVTYIIVAAPTLIISVIVLGAVIMVTLALGVSYLPPDIQSQILSNSKIYPLLLPLIQQLHNLIMSFGG